MTDELITLLDGQIVGRVRQQTGGRLRFVYEPSWRDTGDAYPLSLSMPLGIPAGRIPTTHILKPPTGQFDGHAENEHVCLALARACGLPAATSRVIRFEQEIAIVVERYDRTLSGDRIIRIHQEDVCQASSVMPTRKYQNDGGPGV